MHTMVMSMSMVLAATAAACIPAAPCSDHGAHVHGQDEGDDVWLLVDAEVVPCASRGSWSPVVPPAKKHAANPLMVEDKVWDVRWDNTQPTTMWDAEKGRFRMWYNMDFSCDRMPKSSDGKPNPVFGCGHPTWHQQFPGQTPWQTKSTGGVRSGMAYAESADGVHWHKQLLGIIPYGDPGQPGYVNNTNILTSHGGGTGVMLDARDPDAAARFKMFGTLSYHHCEGRPASNEATDGTVWPPCHKLGASYSADGIHFEHAQNLSHSDKFYDVVGQNDGTLDLAIYDEHLQGYWGLVRIDAGFVGRPGIANANPRRTGRFTTPDMRTNFTAAVQVFNGTADYQVYMVVPFRLPSYRPGFYMATASFLMLNQTVRTELLMTPNWGLNWTQVVPRAQFIPLGDAGAFDSFTTYTGWSGTGEPLLDPANPNRTLFFYAGGDGPHDGQRDDSIGLATAPTHGYAGLRTRGQVQAPNATHLHMVTTAPLQPRRSAGSGDGQRQVWPRWHVLASIQDTPRPRAEGAGPAGKGLRVRARLAGDSGHAHHAAWISPDSLSRSADGGNVGEPQWVELHAPAPATGSGATSAALSAVSWEFHCFGDCTCTVFALRAAPPTYKS